MTDYTYKTDNQIIMMALAELLDHHGGDLYKEITKRTKEQRQHIPLQVRMKDEKTKMTVDGYKEGIYLMDIST